MCQKSGDHPVVGGDALIAPAVKRKAYVSIQRHRYYLSKTFIDKYIELLPAGENTLALCYGNFIIGKIDLDEELFISRKIYRR